MALNMRWNKYMKGKYDGDILTLLTDKKARIHACKKDKHKYGLENLKSSLTIHQIEALAKRM